jgi:Ala-tRNA(Pro) deacylase
MKERLELVKALYQYLSSIDIDNNTICHPEVISCNESKIYYDEFGFDENQYGLCKNILLRDKKGKNFLLVIVDYRKMIDIDELRNVLGTKRLGLATHSDLQEILGVKPGSVSLFSIFNDKDKKVKVVLDEELMTKQLLAFHPNYSGLTSFIRSYDAIKFIDAMKSDYTIIDIPSRVNIEEKAVIKQFACNR